MSRKNSIANFFSGIASLDLFPQPKPVVTPSLENAFQGVWNAFKATGDNMTKAVYEFQQTDKKTTTTNGAK